MGEEDSKGVELRGVSGEEPGETERGGEGREREVMGKQPRVR